VVLGTLGGIGLLISPAGLLAENGRDPDLVDETRFGMDVFAMLFLTSLTGIVLLLLRETPAMGPLLALHLGVVFALFVTMPNGKFITGFIGLSRSCAVRRSGGCGAC
jgi:citrate/tricarballylate utilization protein